MPKSRLYRKLPPAAIPFTTVHIGGKFYSDSQIKSIKISYGKSGNSLSAEVPTATIEIVGKIPMAYNSHVQISTNLTGSGIRFIGRVGSQSFIDHSPTKRISTVVATGHSIRLFRDETVFDAYNSINTLGHAVKFMFNRASVNRVPGGSGQISSSMWAADYFREIKEYKSKDVLALFEKVGIAVVHTRAGGVKYIHPADRLPLMEKALREQYPIQRSNAISPATHEQGTSYVDARPRLTYHIKNSEELQYSDLFSRYFPGVEIPAQAADTEIEELVYSTDAWKYPARINLFRTLLKQWVTPSIKVDLLLLLNGNSYAKKLFSQLVKAEEGDFVTFSGDWDTDLRGAKVIQGIEEVISPTEWSLTFSLGHPSAVFGWSDLFEPMPSPREITWDQKTTNWDNETTRWDEN